MKRRDAAFTLVEMLLVLGIFAILASIVIPAMRSAETPGVQVLESVARVLASDLRLARSHAIQFNTRCEVRFDLANNAYELIPDRGRLPRNLSASSGEDETYRIELDRLGTIIRRDNLIRLAGAAREESGENVAGVTFFAPHGGTEPWDGEGEGEATVIRLIAGSTANVHSIDLIVSWVTGQVWINQPGGG